MASRPVGNGNISFGLVSIPVRLFPATRSKSVSFNLLHAKDQSRIQQKISARSITRSSTAANWCAGTR